MTPLDALDRQLIDLLRRDGRMTYQELAQRVNLSRPAVYERVKRLQRQGLILGYGARVNWERGGYPLAAFVSLRFTGALHDEVGVALKNMVDPEIIVEEAHYITGDDCMLIKVRASSNRALQRFLGTVRNIQGMQLTRTSVILSSFIEEGVPRDVDPSTSESA